MQQDSINYNTLQFINPPSSFPVSSQQIASQIQSQFYHQCMQFLKKERKLYECSRKIQDRLENSIYQVAKLDEKIKAKNEKLQRLSRELKKINHHHEEARSKQEFLTSICKFINMQQARKVMLQPIITDENQFIQKLKQVDMLSEQVINLNSQIKIVQQIKDQLLSLLQQTIEKLIKGNMSQNLITRIISQFSGIFLRDAKISSVFISNLTTNRLNLFRLGLNPLINNVSYVQNISELYQKISQQWILMLEKQLTIFGSEANSKEIKGITRQVMSRLVAQMIPKLERGIYKVKTIVDISKLRFCFSQLKSKLELVGEAILDPLSKILMKMVIILEQKLEQGAEELEISKYNIYSLVSYVPIREHLEMIKEAKSFSMGDKSLNWQRGFKRLADSRDPSKQPNNKSLIIFNLNIWYLYNNVMKNEGQFKEKAELMIKQCVTAFVTLNLASLKKDYEAKNLQKLLDLCADTQTTRKALYSQVNLLGHQKLRLLVEKDVVKRFTQELYRPFLIHHKLEGGIENLQLVELCKKEKLNLNKYGKISQKLRVLTAEEMRQALE